MEYKCNLFNPAINSLYAFIQSWLTLIIKVCKKKNLENKLWLFSVSNTSNYA